MSEYATRLCFSGVESRRLLDTFAQFQVPHIQLSFYYLRKVFSDPGEFEAYISGKGFATIIIDSGLNFHKYRSEPEKAEFLNDYVSYIAALHSKSYHAVVAHKEISLDAVVDTSKLIYDYEDLEQLFEGDVKSIFQQVEYIGLPNKLATNEERMGFIASQAVKSDSRLHAFGTASAKVLKKWPFYSANSTSWRTGSRYANTYIYEGPGRGIKLHQPTDKSDLNKTDREKRVIRTRQRNYVRVRQAKLYEIVDWDAVLEDDSWEVDKGNLTQWLLYQRDYEFDVRNKYYLSEDDKALIKIRKKEVLGTAQDDRRVIEGDNNRNPTMKIGPRSMEEHDDIEDAEIVDTGSFEPTASRNGRIVFSEDEDERETDGVDVDEVPSIPDNSPHNKGHDNDEERPDRGPDSALYSGGDSLPISIVGEGDSATAEIVPFDPTAAIAVAKAERTHPPDERMFITRKCDFCIISDRCPRYKEGADCWYGLKPDAIYEPSKLDDHVLTDAADLLMMQKNRILFGVAEETAEGSGLSKEVNREMKTYMELVQLFSEARDKRDEVTFKAKGSGLLDMFKKR